ncbi:MAG: hypothetical protein M1829_006634 [Trizodia sp. TS-e1964]|nr:MAG: hypothetical protein M1829_006634 [Trizodia sp. TS-e1964]
MKMNPNGPRGGPPHGARPQGAPPQGAHVGAEQPEDAPPNYNDVLGDGNPPPRMGFNFEQPPRRMGFNFEQPPRLMGHMGYAYNDDNYCKPPYYDFGDYDGINMLAPGINLNYGEPEVGMDGFDYGEPEVGMGNLNFGEPEVAAHYAAEDSDDDDRQSQHMSYMPGTEPHRGRHREHHEHRHNHKQSRMGLPDMRANDLDGCIQMENEHRRHHLPNHGRRGQMPGSRHHDEHSENGSANSEANKRKVHKDANGGHPSRVGSGHRALWHVQTRVYARKEGHRPPKIRPKYPGLHVLQQETSLGLGFGAQMRGLQ